MRMTGVHQFTAHGSRRSCGAVLADRDAHSRTAMYVLEQAGFSLTMEIYRPETAAGLDGSALPSWSSSGR